MIRRRILCAIFGHKPHCVSFELYQRLGSRFVRVYRSYDDKRRLALCDRCDIHYIHVEAKHHVG
jgi:hypothetical protein